MPSENTNYNGKVKTFLDAKLNKLCMCVYDICMWVHIHVLMCFPCSCVWKSPIDIECHPGSLYSLYFEAGNLT